MSVRRNNGIVVKFPVDGSAIKLVVNPVALSKVRMFSISLHSSYMEEWLTSQDVGLPTLWS